MQLASNNFENLFLKHCTIGRIPLIDSSIKLHLL